MAYNRVQAQRLCNATEFELFSLSLADAIAALTPAQLRSKLQRARTLRDKHTDLFRRQTASTRARTGTKRGGSGVANERSQQKAELFDQVLKRFEVRLVAVERAQARVAEKAAKSVNLKTAVAKAVKAKAPGKTAAKTSAKAPAKTTARAVVAKKPVAKKPAAKKPTTKPAVKGVSTRVAAARKASSNARAQARRDSGAGKRGR